ncbi:NAD-dependent epimerase/dehydratase family protein [Parenemella sanctibonifatiensis]|nr:NAD-dependent epimerase/dehydratase family protein [Parenemella sanctibonifatiensis]
MNKHIVIGAGPIGRSVAAELAARDQEVVILSRRGRDPQIPGVRAAAVDVLDAAALGRACRGADVLVNAMNPAKYWRWQRDWPPMLEAIIAAARQECAAIVQIGNLYSYGPVTEPMTEQTPERPAGAKGRVRAAMWARLRDLSDQGVIRATEVRASDYIGGTTLDSSVAAQMVVAPVLKGATPRPPTGRADVAHSWTNGADVARLAAAIAASDDDQDWGRLWHVPTAPAASMQELADQAADLAEVDRRRVRPLPGGVLRVGGLVMPLLHALQETAHQFQSPFILDSLQAQQRFGLAPTPWVETVRSTIEAIRAQRASGAKAEGAAASRGPVAAP